MTVPTRRVLFLIADTGGGHRSAANAIQHAMKLLSRSPEPATSAPLRKGRSPGARPHAYASPWEAEIVDAIKEYWRFPLRNGIFLYGPATRHAPRLYGQVFRLTNRTNGFQVGWRLARPFFYQGIVRLLLDTQPDVIVSVHPLLNHVTVDVLRDLGLNIPFITVVTDLVTVHCSCDRTWCNRLRRANGVGARDRPTWRHASATYTPARHAHRSALLPASAHGSVRVAAGAWAGP